MKSIITSLIFLSTIFSIQARFCYQQDSVKVSPAKAGVKGSLPATKLKLNKSSGSLNDILMKSSISINTKEVATGNKARDKKIAKFFFSTMAGGTNIQASVTKVTKKMVTLSITMNGKTKKVPMSYEVNNGAFKAKGFIDVLDFSLNDELSAINKACKALHEGKTWADVELHLEANLKC